MLSVNVFMDWAHVDLNSLLPESGRSEFEVDVSKWTTMPIYMYPPRPPRQSLDQGQGKILESRCQCCCHAHRYSPSHFALTPSNIITGASGRVPITSPEPRNTHEMPCPVEPITPHINQSLSNHPPITHQSLSNHSGATACQAASRQEISCHRRGMTVQPGGSHQLE